ncbi:MAG: hypothetical protein EOP33_00145 [Rickettsiaceae bacterium]|nr:MAG: hypothetical protein EOP33_00145 [Rickettsiaceae bacterium]
MFKHLFSTSSLGIINIAIVSVNLLTTNIAAAESTLNNYTPTLEFSAKGGKRSIGELDYMQPVLSTADGLIATDLKLKLDNNSSKELNLGVIYRHNFDNKVIAGIYSYFDHRRTGHGLAVNGLTVGAELLSKYIDFRANYYVPQNKQRKIVHENKKEIKIQGTSIFAVSGGHTYEHALKGYDLEVGGAIFGFSDDLNEKFGTKLFAAQYNFSNKNTRKISGTRFRLEQKLGRVQFENNAAYLTLNAETQFDKVRKRQNFIGLSAKLAFGEKEKINGLKSRMMDTIIRDVDIVTQNQVAAKEKSNLVDANGRVIRKIIHVGAADANYQGDGTQESPLSISQLASIDISDAIVVVTSIKPSEGGKNITAAEFRTLQARPEVITDQNKSIMLTNTAEDKTTIIIKNTNQGVVLCHDHVDTALIIDNVQKPVIKQANSTSRLVETPLAAVNAQVTQVAQLVQQQDNQEQENAQRRDERAAQTARELEQQRQRRVIADEALEQVEENEENVNIRRNELPQNAIDENEGNIEEPAQQENLIDAWLREGREQRAREIEENANIRRNELPQNAIDENEGNLEEQAQQENFIDAWLREGRERRQQEAAELNQRQQQIIIEQNEREAANAVRQAEREAAQAVRAEAVRVENEQRAELLRNIAEREAARAAPAPGAPAANPQPVGAGGGNPGAPAAPIHVHTVEELVGLLQAGVTAADLRAQGVNQLNINVAEQRVAIAAFVERLVTNGADRAVIEQLQTRGLSPKNIIKELEKVQLNPAQIAELARQAAEAVTATRVRDAARLAAPNPLDSGMDDAQGLALGNDAQGNPIWSPELYNQILAMRNIIAAPNSAVARQDEAYIYVQSIYNSPGNENITHQQVTDLINRHVEAARRDDYTNALDNISGFKGNRQVINNLISNRRDDLINNRVAGLVLTPNQINRVENNAPEGPKLTREQEKILRDDTVIILTPNQINDLAGGFIRDINLTPEQVAHLRAGRINDVGFTPANINRIEALAAIAHGNAAENIGVLQNGPGDISAVDSLNRLRNRYGVIDGSRALDNFIEISKTLIGMRYPDLRPDPQQGAMDARYNVPSADYTAAVNDYNAAISSIAYTNAQNYLNLPADLQNPVESARHLEVIRARDADLARKLAVVHQRQRYAQSAEYVAAVNYFNQPVATRNPADLIMHTEAIAKDRSRMNPYLAGYRALKKIEANFGDYYRDKISKEFEIKQNMGSMANAILDVNEIQHHLLTLGRPNNPSEIYRAQKENLETLLLNLGDAQRGNNKNNNLGIDNGQADSSICAHGHFVRVTDSGVSKHREVIITAASPVSFKREFQQDLTRKINTSPGITNIEKEEIRQFIQDSVIEEYQIRTRYNNRILQLEAFDEDNNVINIPPKLQQITEEVANELQDRYKFLNPNTGMQIITTKQALIGIKGFSQINPADILDR